LDTILKEVRETARTSELSKLLARAESIDAVVNEAAGVARASESSKIATRLEKLDQLLPEVKAVTETQKRIEATVTGGEWNRQWRLGQMRDTYGRLLAALYGLQDYYHHAPAGEAAGAESDEDLREYEGLRKVATEFKIATAFARIFCGIETWHALDKYDALVLSRKGLPEAQRPKAAVHQLYELHKQLLKAAREDLLWASSVSPPDKSEQDDASAP
jgi:hypothetical protein